jgi:branched-chain amino acid transport system permease protein
LDNVLDYVGLGAYTSLVIFILLNMLLAASVQVVMASGVFSVASIAFAALGAYASAYMTKIFHLPLGVGIFVAIVVCMAVAPIFLLPAQRLKGMYLALASLAFVLVFQVFALNATPLTGGAQGQFGIPLLTTLPAVFLATLAGGYLLFVTQSSRTGRALRTMRFDPQLAMTFGVDLLRYRLLVLELSAVLAAVSGAFTAHYLAFISPDLYGFDAVTTALAAAIFGGLESWVGAYLGAGVLTMLPQLLLGIAGWADLINGALIVAVMVFQPGGLLVGVTRLSGFMRRRIPGFAR